MPFVRVHWWLFVLFPIILLAFWPSYFSAPFSATFAFHVHSVSATLWVGLLGLQSWSMATHRISLHRKYGQAVFAVAPLFVMGGLFVTHSMAVKFAEGVDPFYSIFGARLASFDLIAIVAFAGFVATAIRRRRTMSVHASYLVATITLLLSPVLARIPPSIPGLAPPQIPGVHPFEMGFQAGQLLTLIIIMLLHFRTRGSGGAFLIAGVLTILQSLLFETLGAAGPWNDFIKALATLDPWLLATAGGLLTLGLLLFAWQQPLRQRRSPLASR